MAPASCITSAGARPRARKHKRRKSSGAPQKRASPQAINLGAVRGKGVTSTTWRGRSPAVTPACHGFLPMARILQPVDKYAQHLRKSAVHGLCITVRAALSQQCTRRPHGRQRRCFAAPSPSTAFLPCWSAPAHPQRWPAPACRGRSTRRPACRGGGHLNDCGVGHGHPLSGAAAATSIPRCTRGATISRPARASFPASRCADTAVMPSARPSSARVGDSP